jgi:mannose-6-phosphate isomerase
MLGAGGSGQIMKGTSQSNNTLVYKSPVEEFDVSKTQLTAGKEESIPGIKGPSIMLIVQGSGSLREESSTSPISVTKGETFFVGADTPLHLSTSQSGIVVYTAFCSLE